MTVAHSSGIVTASACSAEMGSAALTVTATLSALHPRRASGSRLPGSGVAVIVQFFACMGWDVTT